jgi:L-asparaginase/Glu-tRNA(Gln) amidotransferase subunit D
MYENIHIITTGGTIDVAQIKEDGSYTFAESGIPKMLKQ